MKRHRKLMFAFLAILALAAASCAKLQARDNLNKGVRAFRDAHYENAVTYFKQAVELDPDLTTAEIYLATASSQQFIPGGRGEDNEKNAQLAIQTFNKRNTGESFANVLCFADLATTACEEQGSVSALLCRQVRAIERRDQMLGNVNGE